MSGSAELRGSPGPSESSRDPARMEGPAGNASRADGGEGVREEMGGFWASDQKQTRATEGKWLVLLKGRGPSPPSASFLLPLNSSPQLQQSQGGSPPHPVPRPPPPRLPAAHNSAGLWPSFRGRTRSCDPAAPGPRPSRLLPGTSLSPSLSWRPILGRGSAHRSATVLPWQQPGLTACA